MAGPPPAGRPFAYDPFAPEVMADPFPFYRVLRDHHPVYRLEGLDAWAVSRFDDAYQVLSETGTHFTTTEGDLLGPAELRRGNGGVVPEHCPDPLPSFLTTESPVHEEIRQAAGGPLRPRSVLQLEAFVRDQARARLDELVPRGRFNLTTEYGGRVSAATMCLLFGLPLDRAGEVLATVNELTRTDPEVGGFTEATEARARMGAMLAEAIGARRRAGADGAFPVIDGLLRYRRDGRALSDDEVRTQLGGIFVGGTETLPKVVAHGLMELAGHPEQRAAVLADVTANVRIAFEEMLRLCGPAQWFTRTVKAPVVVGGQELAVGDRVLVLIASAARDEREFDEPDAFHWDRTIPRSLAFGHGQLFCIGSHLARLEGRVLIEELLARVPDYTIDVGATVRPPSSFQLGWSVVPLVVPER